MIYAYGLDTLTIRNNVYTCLIVVGFCLASCGECVISVQGIETRVSCFLGKHCTTVP